MGEFVKDAVLFVLGAIGFLLTSWWAIKPRAMDGYTKGDRNYDGSRSLLMAILGILILIVLKKILSAQ